MTLPVGGFFELQTPPAASVACLRHWGIHSEHQTWVNASSAFHALICALSEQKLLGCVWLPAIICPVLAACVPQEKLRFYPLNALWSPCVSTLDAKVSSNDLILAVNYCGQPPGLDFLEWIAHRTDIYSVEDCAHCLFSGLPPWGDWQLFSPRKIIGVPDGGLLCACSNKAKYFQVESKKQFQVTDEWLLGALKPLLMRQQTQEPEVLLAAYQLRAQWEKNFIISPQHMSRFSWDILASTPINDLIQKRKKNYHQLACALVQQGWRCEAGMPDYAPFGLRLQIHATVRDLLRQFLHANRIFTVIHWPELPSPEIDFPNDHARQAAHLILPLDHRYQIDDIDCVIHVMKKAAAWAVHQ